MRPLDLLHISIADQRLYGFADGQLIVRLPVSTALNGAGEQSGSNCTPRGRHQVRAKIGDGLPLGAVLRGRRWTGEVWSEELDAQFPGKVDTFRRYIYLHGTPDTQPMGVPLSHGCVRLRNADLLDLFPRVPPHCAVLIDEAPRPEWATAKLC
jgi:lipoprotein-anchoring transpeptidase ErfK/SrfK